MFQYYFDGSYLDGDCYGDGSGESFDSLLVGRVWLELVINGYYTEKFITVSGATYQRLLDMGKIYGM